jgi:hypothetical protein
VAAELPAQLQRRADTDAQAAEIAPAAGTSP